MTSVIRRAFRFPTSKPVTVTVPYGYDTQRYYIISLFHYLLLSSLEQAMLGYTVGPLITRDIRSVLYEFRVIQIQERKEL